MKYVVIVCRFLLGVPFMIFGLNMLHPFMPMPPMPPDSLPGKFMTVMGPSHWMMLVGVCELLGGLLVVLGRTTPLGLVILGPVLVNVLAFHIFLTGGHGLGMGLVLTVLEVFLIYAYRGYFLPFLRFDAKMEAEKK